MKIKYLPVVLFVFALMSSDAYGAAISRGNLLLSANNQIYEYTTQGTYVQSFSTQYAGGGYPVTEYARDVAAQKNGKVHIYNGTFAPYMSTYDSNASLWSHTTYAGFSTVNNGSFGGIDVFDTTVFATDMFTYSGGEAQGVVAFNTATGQAQRFATNIEPIDLTIGLDGLLYTLSPGGSPEGTTINIFDPSTLAYIGSIGLPSIFGWTGHRSIAVDYNGDIFVADWDGDVQHVSKAGELINTININRSINDIDISRKGEIALSTRFGEVFLTDPDFSTITPFAGTGTFVEFVPDPTPVTRVITNPAKPDGLNGWYKTNPSIALAAENASATTLFSWDATASPQGYAGAFNIPSQGVRDLYYYSVDASGAAESIRSKQFKLDNELPTDPVPESPSHIVDQPSSDRTIEISLSGATDTASGVDGYSISWSRDTTELPNTVKDLEENQTTASSANLPDGTWYSNLRTVDYAGNWSQGAHFGPLVIDGAPSTSVSVDLLAPNGDNGWYTAGPEISFSIDQTGTTYFSWDATTTVATYTVPFEPTLSGFHTLHYFSVDTSGNVEAAKDKMLKIDRAAPTDPNKITSSVATGTVLRTRSIDISFSGATDTVSGVEGYAYSWSEDSTAEPYPFLDIATTGVTETISDWLPDGTWWFNLSTKDAAGNWTSTVHLGPFIIDAPPSTLLDPWPFEPNGDNGWYVTPPDIWLLADEMATINYQWDATGSAGWISVIDWEANAGFAPEGRHTLNYFSADLSGQIEPVQSAEFAVDLRPPTNPAISSPSHTIGGSSGDRTVDINLSGAADAVSGVDGFSYTWRRSAVSVPDKTKDVEENQVSVTSGSLVNGAWYFHLRTKDNAGNWSGAVHVGPFNIVTDADSPTNPALSSPSHRTGEPSGDQTVEIKLSGATDTVSGINGFSISWDQSQIASPDMVIDWKGTAERTISPPLSDGSWYFHLRTVDGAGNWSSAVNLGPFLIDSTFKGSLYINNNYHEATSPIVNLRLQWPGGIGEPAFVRFRNENKSWANWQTFARSATWRLSSEEGNGKKSVGAQFKGETGLVSAEVYDEILLNARLPYATISAPELASAASTTTEFMLAWSGSGSPGSSGVTSFDIDFRESATGQWKNWLAGTAATTAVFKGREGATYYFRARTTDDLGIAGTWSGPQRVIVPYDQNRLVVGRSGFDKRYSGAKKNFYLSAPRYSIKQGDSITYRFKGNYFAIIATKGPGLAQADIYLDGRFRTTVDARLRHTRHRQVVWFFSFRKTKLHWVKIVNKPVGKSRRLDIDAIAVGR